MWYMVSLLCWTLHLMVFGIIIAGIGFELWLVITIFFGLAFEVYLIWVAYALMQEINHHSTPDGTETEAHIALIEVGSV